VIGGRVDDPTLHATWKIGRFDRDIAPCCSSVVIAKSVPCPPISIIGVCSDRFFQR
jgi:hypothetical protein